ncbi:hypothetical protein PRIPAC_77077 [Pristionchus pacificus]|uniref:Uncharacterized protein n=1 Tax=Pristionchus pacificus TaxID=54126 RepID=A0A2A6BWK4_PRIPA|nr:hypothetical protein PRIPAC_77077 [Pristionchus pacificus]|eukprot:PDM70294.1 hypothetical protein PRIPAC_46540 [Pristionchus pacificus]
MGCVGRPEFKDIDPKGERLWGRETIEDENLEVARAVFYDYAIEAPKSRLQKKYSRIEEIILRYEQTR